MATILIDALAGSGNLEAHTPNTGSASYVLESGGSLVIASTAARSATTDTESKYRYDVASGTAACRVVMDFYIDNADGASYATMYVNRQDDGEAYEMVVQGNGNCTLYHMSAGGSATTIQSFGSVGFSGYWRFDVAHDGSGGFVVSAWRSVDRADLGSAPYLVVNAATATDGGANITTAGKTGLRVRNAAYLGAPSPGFSDSAAAGPVLSTPTVVSTGNTIATVRVTTDTAPTGSSILAVRTRPAGDPAWTAAEVLASPTATITSGASGARDFNLTGLTNGTALAADFAQTGPSNVVSTASFTPSTVPGAPTIGTATAGNAQATVAGTAPVSNGGSAITGYRSTATPGGSTVTGVSLPITHTGLTNGTAYTFTLAAQNANGYGAESAASNSVTPSSGADVTPPTLSSPSGAGGTLTCSGSVTTDEANGTLYTVATDSTTAPTALQVEAGQDHTGAAALRVVSQAVSASGSQAVASGAVTAGTRYLHFMHKDAAGNRSSVASSAAFTVSASVSATYTATTDILARNGIALASTPIFWSWLPAGRPGAVGSVVNGTGTTDSAGRYTLSQSAAGQGLLLIGLALGSWDADAPGFAQYLTLA